jgi:hypothetical protein
MLWPGLFYKVLHQEILFVTINAYVCVCVCACMHMCVWTVRFANCPFVAFLYLNSGMCELGSCLLFELYCLV